MTDFYSFKLFLTHATGFSMDALHMLAGPLLQLAIAAIARMSIARWTPWTAVLLLELINEIHDLWIERWPDLAMQYGEGAKDLILTMILPTVLLTAARTRPALFSK